jgi:hypothetical protein
VPKYLQILTFRYFLSDNNDILYVCYEKIDKFV